MHSTKFLAQRTKQRWTWLPPREKLTRTRQGSIPCLRRSRIREKINHSFLSGGALTTAQAHRTAAKHHPRRIALFGGSFDPIHNGHLAVARAADRRFNFDEIHFIPASRPPHKL